MTGATGSSRSGTLRRPLAILGVGLAATAAIAAAFSLAGPARLLDVTREPVTIYVTNPFQVGSTYTFGSTAVPADAKRPVRVTAIDVIATAGVEVVGTGALDLGAEGIGLVPGWPPPAPYEVIDPFADGQAFDGEVQPLVGFRTLAPVSGFRGIEIRWIDADGRAGGRVFDFAVVTCAHGACDADQDGSDVLLRRLGLLR